MNKTIVFKSECIGRVTVFGGRADITFTAKETSLFASLTPIKTALAEAAAQQSGGNRGYREMSGERLAAAIATRVIMRDIAEIAKALAERGVDVGAAEAFRMPPSTSYVALAAAAQAFLDLVEPRKALFTERGLAAIFDADLAAHIATLTTAGETAGTERSRQRGGTAGLDAQADEGMKIVRELRAILRVKFRSNPALLAEWTSVARVHAPAPPDEEEEAPTTPPAGSGSGEPVGSGTLMR